MADENKTETPAPETPATPDFQTAANAVAEHIRKLVKVMRAKKRAGMAA